MSGDWQIVIFMIEGKANHCGLSIPEIGLADCSLLGARVIPWLHRSVPKGEKLFFDLKLPHPEKALEFLRTPGLLCEPIRAQERKSRGWHLTREAPDFVRTLRDKRSSDPGDMNCVEWIAHALELGGRKIAPSVMTPTELMRWCQRGFLEED